MSTLHQVIATIANEVSAALAAAGVAADVAAGWPPENRLQDIARRGTVPAVAIYNRRVGRNATRWAPYTYNIIDAPTNLTVSPNAGQVSAGGSIDLTLGGMPAVGDAVGVIIVPASSSVPVGNPATKYEVHPAWGAAIVSGDGVLSTTATNLAAAINDDPILAARVTASATGAVVTITAGSKAVRVSAATGAGATGTREVGRRERQVQIACWMRTEEEREALAAPLEALIADWEASFSLNTVDGTPIRAVYVNDYDVEDATLQDVYRRDFIVGVEYPVTILDRFYAILTTQIDLQIVVDTLE